MNIEDFDEKIINKAKEYAETRGLETIKATIEIFESTKDRKYKKVLFESLIETVHDIDTFDRELEEWRASRGAAINKGIKDRKETFA